MSKLTYQPGEILCPYFASRHVTNSVSRHEITTPEINKDYFKTFAAEPSFPAPISVVLPFDNEGSDSEGGGSSETAGEDLFWG